MEAFAMPHRNKNDSEFCWMRFISASEINKKNVAASDPNGLLIMKLVI